MKTNSDAVADIEFQLHWNSPEATHTDCYHATSVNFWRDYFPPPILEKLMGIGPGGRRQIDLAPEQVLPSCSPTNLRQISRTQFNLRADEGHPLQPRSGRFYPKGVLSDIPGIFPNNVEPFRCTRADTTDIRIDLNHALARTPLRLEAIVRDVRGKQSERGGQSNDWMGILSSGPGMQCRWDDRPTDFFSDDPFFREDPGRDSVFYRTPRLVHHIDETARSIIRNLYGSLLSDGMDILDLMSSWVSHLPENLKPARVSGLGLNHEELEKNPALTDYVIHDLNDSPVLPFDSASFDAVICTVSVEYLVQPDTVFLEISRVLRPEGIAIMTVSNRWFPPKVIRIWKELHEFERQGLILEYFHRTGSFKNLETYSIRGLPRPTGDPYYPDMQFSDPVFAVWGQAT